MARDTEDTADDGVEDDGEEGSLSAADDDTLSQLNTLHVIVIKVCIFVDVLLLVRRLSLIAVAVKGIQQIPRVHYDATMTSRHCITWPATVDQSQQPLAARQNGGPYCVPRPTDDDVVIGDVTTSHGLGSPEVVRVLGDVSLLYVTLSVGTLCLLVAALCACAALLQHFFATVARGSFLLPVSTYLRSAIEFLISEGRHLSEASVTAVQQHYELTSLQHVINVFNTGLVTPTHCLIRMRAFKRLNI